MILIWHWPSYDLDRQGQIFQFCFIILLGDFDIDLYMTLTENVSFCRFWQGEIKQYPLWIPIHKQTNKSRDVHAMRWLLFLIHIQSQQSGIDWINFDMTNNIVNIYKLNSVYFQHFQWKYFSVLQGNTLVLTV